jgi:hypothetical protein
MDEKLAKRNFSLQSIIMGVAILIVIVICLMLAASAYVTTFVSCECENEQARSATIQAIYATNTAVYYIVSANETARALGTNIPKHTRDE